MPDPYGRAIREFAQGEQSEPLWRLDGADREDHPIRAFYFTPYDGTDPLLESLDGPLLDVGSGVGRHAVVLQERIEVVATDVSEHLVETAREYGVTDARVVDMFELQETFPRDRFQSALAIGTQLGLAGSLRGVSALLADLACVTTPDARAVVDAYDPARADTAKLLGYRPLPEPGLAHRVFHFEYEGDVGRELLFLLFSPERLREAVVGTDWRVADVDHGDDAANPYYRAALEKR
ncbi:class I SAM-dependent methyltransferase [Halorarius litoreus]|uniref:class I SAM-dependent methyltransferase n=1 Tax=Halorarius litoreus TaxID=2962676 RepID=UPI0020CED6F3|nr:class I SAM-dependent methyltransferase [Halorarius litoreus]